MHLNDIFIDYISVFPDGTLHYLKLYIKQQSDMDLMTFIRNIEADSKINSSNYGSIYMNKFLYVIKNEYDERIKKEKEVSSLKANLGSTKLLVRDISTYPTNKLSIEADEFVPVNMAQRPEYITNTTILKEVALKDIYEKIVKYLPSFVDYNMNQHQLIPIEKFIQRNKFYKYSSKGVIEYACTIDEFIELVKNETYIIIIGKKYYKSTHWKTLNDIAYQNNECIKIINQLIDKNKKENNNGVLFDTIMKDRFINNCFHIERLKTLIMNTNYLKVINVNGFTYINRL